MADLGEKKKCFVVTPIGNNDTAIRRHIDGIIDQAIMPALGEKYDIDVAHRNYEIGSINDRVIRSIHESELVIANLTGINPNVMFELAIRYSFGKPALVIAEEGTKLPFDINDENVIFYINDPAGAFDLKEKLKEAENKIDFEKKNFGPVFKAVRSIPLYQEVESGKAVSNDKLMYYVIERLDSIERQMAIGTNSTDNNRYYVHFVIELDGLPSELSQETKEQVINEIGKYSDVMDCKWLYDGRIYISGMTEKDRLYVSKLARKIKNNIRLLGVEVENTKVSYS